MEYKEILEATISLNSWIQFQQTCSIFPQESGKLTSIFFLSGVAVSVIICSMAQSGSDCSAVTQVDVKTGNLLKRFRKNCFPKAVLDGNLMAVSYGKDK